MKRSPEQSALLSRITLDPGICHGKPCIRGLRYPVLILLDLLHAGMTHEETLDDYADLEEDDLRAVLTYADLLNRRERVAPDAP